MKKCAFHWLLPFWFCITAFDSIKRLALGADHINMARPMMFALGCIQARKCNSNRCPTGITTNNPYLEAGLVPAAKDQRVRNFHRATLEAIAGILGAMALDHREQLRPWQIAQRVSLSELKNYSKIFEFIGENSLKHEPVSLIFENALKAASAETFL